MPAYEYQCKSCEGYISVTRSISDPDPGYVCNTCNLPMTKVYSIGAVTFNGSGFYRTDKGK
jgi:putative FmdB family regulatory protein